MDRTPEEIEQRICGIVASAAFESMESSEEDIELLRRLGAGEITEAEYDKYYGLNPKGGDTP